MSEDNGFCDTPLQWTGLRKRRLTDNLIENLTFITPTEIPITEHTEWEKGWDEIIERGDLP